MDDNDIKRAPAIRGIRYRIGYRQAHVLQLLPVLGQGGRCQCENARKKWVQGLIPLRTWTDERLDGRDKGG